MEPGRVLKQQIDGLDVQGRTTVGHPIDVATGYVYATRQDISIPGKVALTWERRYHTGILNMPASPLGPGWTTRYFATLTKGEKEFRFLTPEGSLEVFADPTETVDRGGTIRNLGTFQEINKRAERYIITRWNVDSGEVERYVFKEAAKGAAWPLESIEDVTGQGLEMLRDKTGRLTGIRQRLEKRTLLLDYTPNGRIKAVLFQLPRDQRQMLASYAHDEEGRLVAAYDALLSVDRYEYDAFSRMTREIIKDGGVFYFKYDEKGRCIKTSGLDRYDEKTLRYLDAIRWTEVTDSLGNTTRYQHLPTGQVICEIDPLGAMLQTEYDDCGRIIAKTDPNGAPMKYGFDALGNRCKVTDPLGHAYHLAFTQQHLPLTLTDPLGGTWRREYDGNSRLVATEDPLGCRYTAEYDSSGNLVAVLSADGRRQRQKFSATGILLETIDWMGHTTRYRLDDYGRVVETSGPSSESLQFHYDILGRMTRLILSDSTELNFTYDSAGNLKSFTDGNGHTTSYRYGPCRRLLEMVRRTGELVKYRWGTEPKRLEQVIKENGEAYTLFFDAAGRVVRERCFDGREHSFEYDPAGHCIGFVNRNAERIALNRDLLGRLIGQVLPDKTRLAFEYDALGNLVAAVNPDAAVTFQRDSLGRITREVQGRFAVETIYDAIGNVIRTGTSLGHQARYEVDANSRLTKLVVNERHSFEFARNGRGDEISRLMPGNVRLQQQYDKLGRLIEQRVCMGGFPADILSPISTARPMVNRAYAYDRSGAVLSIHDGYWGELSYNYDPAERILATIHERFPAEQFAYDVAGNPTSMASGDCASGSNLVLYGPGDRLLQKGRTQYFYDDQGRLVRKVENVDGPSTCQWEYSWDALDQLRSVRTPEGQVWKYGYDALGRRISKEGPGVHARFVWDGHVILHELENDTLRSTWIFDRTNLAPLCQLQNDDIYSVVPDHLGTPREMLDQAGRIVWRSSHSTWGQARSGRPNTVDCQIRFPGQWFDPESGLHYNRFRFYDPQTGRYISQDPIGLLSGGLNFYAYAKNPINWVDPFGLAGLNWSNPKSTPTWGHTFSTHGQGSKNTTALTGRAGGTGNNQGQWLNNAAAASFLAGQRPGIQGPVVVPIPPGLGQVIRPDGSIVPATHALLVPKDDGSYRTAYPITKDSDTTEDSKCT